MVAIADAKQGALLQVDKFMASVTLTSQRSLTVLMHFADSTYTCRVATQQISLDQGDRHEPTCHFRHTQSSGGP
jgi:hypothetical protein